LALTGGDVRKGEITERSPLRLHRRLIICNYTDLGGRLRSRDQLPWALVLRAAAYAGLTTGSVQMIRVTTGADDTRVVFREVLHANDNVIDRFDFVVTIDFPPVSTKLGAWLLSRHGFADG